MDQALSDVQCIRGAEKPLNENAISILPGELNIIELVESTLQTETGEKHITGRILPQHDINQEIHSLPEVAVVLLLHATIDPLRRLSNTEVHIAYPDQQKYFDTGSPIKVSAEFMNTELVTEPDEGSSDDILSFEDAVEHQHVASKRNFKNAGKKISSSKSHTADTSIQVSGNEIDKELELYEMEHSIPSPSEKDKIILDDDYVDKACIHERWSTHSSMEYLQKAVLLSQGATAIPAPFTHSGSILDVESMPFLITQTQEKTSLLEDVPVASHRPTDSVPPKSAQNDVGIFDQTFDIIKHNRMVLSSAGAFLAVCIVIRVIPMINGFSEKLIKRRE